MTRVLLLLGSNLDRESNFCRAAQRLAELVPVVAFSPVYETEPMGGPAQPRFLNAAALIETDLEPQQLKDQVLRRIEGELGRVRGPDKFAPRTIDLDIILFGERAFHLSGRQVPDPELLRYAHIARPAADVAPDWLHPVTGESLRTIAGRLPSQQMVPRPDIILKACTEQEGDSCHR